MKCGCKIRILVVVAAGVLTLSGPPARAGDETVQGMLAAQVQLQGFLCVKPLGATRDAKRSRPDYAVWVLSCSNATYRVSRAPDMAAKIEPLH